MGEVNNGLEYTRDGELLYIRSSYELIKKVLTKSDTSFKMRDKMFLEIEALSKRYQENFSPSPDDSLLNDIAKLQEGLEVQLGRTFFEELLKSYKKQFKQKSSVAADKHLLVDLIDMVKRYQVNNALGGNDPLLMEMETITEQVRQSIQGKRYLERIAAEYREQFKLHYDQIDKCEQIYEAAQKEYEKIKNNHGYNEADADSFVVVVEDLSKEISKKIQQDGYRQLHEIVSSVKVDNNIENLDVRLKLLMKLSERINKYCASDDDIVLQIKQLHQKISIGLEDKKNNKFIEELTKIQRQFLYAHNEEDYKRLLERVSDLQPQINKSTKKIKKDELQQFEDLKMMIKEKYRKVHLEGFKNLFKELQNRLSLGAQSERDAYLKKISFLIREYDSEYDAARKGDIFFGKMKAYEAKMRESLTKN